MGASSISIPSEEIDVCLDAGFISQLVTAIVGVSYQVHLDCRRVAASFKMLSLLLALPTARARLPTFVTHPTPPPQTHLRAPAVSG